MELIPRNESNSVVDSDFEVTYNGKFGGLLVRFTFSFTEAGQMHQFILQLRDWQKMSWTRSYVPQDFAR